MKTVRFFSAFALMAALGMGGCAVQPPLSNEIPPRIYELFVAGRQGVPPLHGAVVDGSLKDIQARLKKDSLDLNESYPDFGWPPPLHLAVLHGNLDVAELLLEKGASPHLKYKEYRPAHIAAAKGDLKVLSSSGNSRPTSRPRTSTGRPQPT